MKDISKVAVLAGVTTITGLLVVSLASAYEEGTAGKAIVEGSIAFKGTPPPPMVYPLNKHFDQDPDAKYCSRFDRDGKGNRIRQDITVNKGNLQDVVVYIQNITQGKPFTFNGTDVKIQGCRYLVQGGPSTFVGVVVKGAELRVLNEDPDASNQTLGSPYHFVHGYAVPESVDRIGSTIFNTPLPRRGQLFTDKIEKLNGSNSILLASDNHSFMMAWFYVVENPYYAIVGPNGKYVIDQIPAGKYMLLAWHPILGTQKKEIEVGPTGKITVNFEFFELTTHAK
jgi:hypothetical protein